MPRKARKKSESGIYHIMIRGINRQNIFEDEEDYIKFMQTIYQYKEKSQYEIYAYCLMSNHVHLLIKVGEEPLEQIMRRICGSYVYWYNWKNQRIGNLFQDRFKSEPVENDSYLLTVLRYIHQNPLKAGLVKDVERYRWSSYHEYIREVKLVNIEIALKILNESKDKAIEKFIEYHSENNDDVCLEMLAKHRITDDEAKKIINKLYNAGNVTDMQKLDTKTRDKYLKELKEEHGLSIRQIERLTGINRGVIAKV